MDYKAITEKMIELAKYTNDGQNCYDAEKAKEYYATQKLYWKMRNEESSELTAKVEATPITFVNGYGEATHREITSTTYKRCQKRLNKKVNSFMS